MMIHRTVLFSVLIVIMMAGFALSDIYKYRDAQGIIRYTYDLAEVPEDQRPEEPTYIEEVPDTIETPNTETPSGSVSDESKEEPKDEAPVVDDKKIEELNQRKKELDEEFAGLMEEKYALLKDKERLKGTLEGRDEVAVAKYDRKVNDLNKRIADYKKRQEEFQKEAEAVKKAIEGSENSEQ